MRRGIIGEKYGTLVDALYGGKRPVHVEAQVRYEDGRTGTISADLKIRDAKTFPAAGGEEGGLMAETGRDIGEVILEV